MWLQRDEVEGYRFYDQFADIFDFAWGFMDLSGSKPSDAMSLLFLCRFHLQAAAAIVTAAYDFRGAVQSALLASELALKAGLAAHQVDEAVRRKHGHDLTSAAEALSALTSNFDASRVINTVRSFPCYVPNRYSPDQPERRQAGHIIMGAQYVAGEVMRQLSDRNFRADADPSWDRTYPAD